MLLEYLCALILSLMIYSKIPILLRSLYQTHRTINKQERACYTHDRNITFIRSYLENGNVIRLEPLLITWRERRARFLCSKNILRYRVTKNNKTHTEILARDITKFSCVHLDGGYLVEYKAPHYQKEVFILKKSHE